jgi:hypothetical protein
LIEAGKNTFTENGKSSGFSIGISRSMISDKGAITPFANNNKTVNIGVNSNKNWGDGTNWSNSSVNVGGNTNYDVGGDLTIRGGIISTGTISGTIGGNTIIESLQDTYKGGSSGYSFNVGIGIGKHFVNENGHLLGKVGTYISSIGGGFNVGKIESKITTDPTTFRADAGKLDIEGKLTQIGSLIDGGFTLNAGSYEYKDLVDINKSYNFGIRLTINPGVIYTMVDKERNAILSHNGITIGSEFQIGYKNQSRNVSATIGSGIITNFDTGGVNRDSSKMVGSWVGSSIETATINLGTEYWLTEAGRETTREQMVQFKNNVVKLVDRLKVSFINNNKILTGLSDSETLSGIQIGRLQILNKKMIEEYIDTNNEVSKLLIAGEYDDKLREAGIDEETISKIKTGIPFGDGTTAVGMDALLILLDSNKIASLYDKVFDINNRFDYDNKYEKFSLMLALNYKISNTLEKILDETDVEKLEYLLNERISTKVGSKDGKTIEVFDIVSAGGEFFSLTGEEQRNALSNMINDLEDINITVLGNNGIVVKVAKPLIIFDDSSLNGAGGLFNSRAKLVDGKIITLKERGTIILTEMNEKKYTHDEDINTYADTKENEGNYLGIGINLLTQILHEGSYGHSLHHMILTGDIGNDTLRNALQMDIFMLNNNSNITLKSNKREAYYNNGSKRIYYFGGTSENLAYDYSGRGLKDYLMEINIKKGTNFSTDYEYLRDIYKTSNVILKIK